MPNSNDSEQDKKVSFLQVAKSILGAFIGIQSTANRERDFKHGKMSHFIWIGLLLGVGFVLSLLGIVQLVLHFATS